MDNLIAENKFKLVGVIYSQLFFSGLLKVIITRRDSCRRSTRARLICNRRKYDHVTPLLRYVLHSLPVPFRIRCKFCLLAFQSLSGATPEYLRDCCTWTLSSALGFRFRS